MKRLLGVSLLVLLASSISLAQLGFGGGAQAGISISSFPKGQGQTESYYGMGFGFGGHGDLKIIKYVWVRLGIDYHTFASDKTKLQTLLAQANGVNPSDVSFSGFNIGILGFTLNGIGRIPAGPMFTPYGILGLGLHILSVSDPKVTYRGQEVNVPGFGKVESVTKFGLNFGAGAEVKLGAIGLFLEIKYVLIFTEGSSTGHIPITVGVNF